MFVDGSQYLDLDGACECQVFPIYFQYFEIYQNNKTIFDKCIVFAGTFSLIQLWFCSQEELKKNNKKLSLKEETISKMQFQIEEMSREVSK